MEIKIRQACHDDKGKIVDLARLLHLDGMANFVWDTEGFVEKQIKRREYFIAELEGILAGAISLRERGGKMYIETIIVEERFQSKGIGAELLSFAKEFAVKNGFKLLAACSFPEYSARDFYLKNGFSLLKKKGRYNGREFFRYEINLA